ncbi:MAG: fumarylacetoacetate hydrolase family protein [Promethearchaeota archaeon]
MKFLNYLQNNIISNGILLEPDQILNLKTIFQFLNKDTSMVDTDTKVFNNYATIKPIIDEFLKKNIKKIQPIHLSEVKLLSPVLNPSKIICLGLNYRDHALETGTKLPKLPMLFSKAPSAIVAHKDAIKIPNVRKKMDKESHPIRFIDYEVELAIVVGKHCNNVLIEDVYEYIFGYTILNDVSARMEQFADKQFFRSKSFDTFAPLGPWIVTSDQIGNPMNLHLECKVNGTIKQNSNTGNMNFNIYEIISFISEAITLLPGDIVGTGTPPGVGIAKKPPQSLKSGDLIEMTIENIGTLQNHIL